MRDARKRRIKSAISQAYHKAAGQRALGENEFYGITYRAYISWFSSIDNWSDEDVLIGAGLAYSWMGDYPDSSANKIYSSKNSESSFTHWAAVATWLNDEERTGHWYDFCFGSVTATSKFLHFWKPDQYSIVDSRVRKFLATGILDVEGYEFYRTALRDICGGNAQTMRMVEHYMWEQGGRMTAAERSSK